MFRKLGLMLFAVMMVMALVPAGADAGNGNGRGNSGDGYDSPTTVPGQQGREGVVTGHYTQEGSGCTYVVNYRGDFGGDEYLDSGWIMNNITCPTENGTSTYHYLIVHESDPRYTGNPEWAIWGNWEYHVLTIGGQDHSEGHGNLVRPYTHVGNNE